MDGFEQVILIPAAGQPDPAAPGMSNTTNAGSSPGFGGTGLVLILVICVLGVLIHGSEKKAEERRKKEDR